MATTIKDNIERIMEDYGVDESTFTYDISQEQVKYAYAFLEESGELLRNRGKEYDTTDKEPSGGERSMGKTIEMFNICTNKDLTEAEGWLLLQLLKDVRQWTKPEYHEDSAIDCISYAALKAEALAGGK